LEGNITNAISAKISQKIAEFVIDNFAEFIQPRVEIINGFHKTAEKSTALYGMLSVI
jgi:hypothetical protein